jgi:tRNA(Ile)-lysidine synthetase-like protein
VLRRDADRWVLERTVAPGADVPAVILGPGSGVGEATIAGRRVRVCWRTAAGPAADGEAFRIDALAFPVVVRGRRPGDVLARAAGHRPLRRWFIDRRVPASERSRIPVVADARGVLWVPGFERAARAEPAPGRPALVLAVEPAG